MSLAETGSCWAGSAGSAALHEALLLLTQHHVSTSTLGPYSHFQSLVGVRRGKNMRGQHITRASPEKFTGFQHHGPFSFLSYFLEEEATVFMSIFKPFVPRDAEGDSQELHTAC